MRSEQTRAPRSWRARSYARWFRSALGRAYKSSVESVLEPWIAAARPRLALDAGCGPILTFADLFGPEATLLAVDCSFEIARGAHSKMKSLGRSGAACCGSVESLPFRSSLFDFVLSMNCLEFVPDPGRALRELRRVAAPQAAAVIGTLNRHGLWELGRRLGRPFRSSAYYRGRFFTVEELVAVLRDAGWRVEEVRHAVPFPPVRLPSPKWYRLVARAVPADRSGMVIARVARGDD
ncbi:MAG TPA: methyltransferase domain-containing protein [Planctomycetota bacterium]|nr:methyltransferase domain-containing protein [Planctomycetota bacterium]